MGTYKGNNGNLMQHWTLCEVLHIAQKQGVTDLNYIDAHTMAPLATRRTDWDPVFDSVRARLANGMSVYERAWDSLDPNMDGYANSAAFVTEVWKGDYSLLLCEIDRNTSDEIESWLSGVRKRQACKATELALSDWRRRFKNGLPSPTDVGLGSDSLTLLSFDPNMIGISTNKGLPKEKPWNMYPQDLELVANAVQALPGQVLLQLSTYTANGGNSQDDVAPLVDCRLGAYGFERVAKVRVNGHMMSLIYTRGIEQDSKWAAELGTLHKDFQSWIKLFLKKP